MLLTFRGCSALSGFRIDKYRALIQEQAPAITSLHVEYAHFVQLTEPLSDTETDRLEDLLHYGSHAAHGATTGMLLLVTPRPGTISPWSSKATDIAHNCGLHKIKRIERGTAWRLPTQGPSLSASSVEKIKPLIHDRMTETGMQNFEE